jgi:uncharacterized membrane protein
VNFAIVSLIILVPVFIIALILFAVLTGRAASRNQNRPESERRDEPGDQDSEGGRQ